MRCFVSAILVVSLAVLGCGGGGDDEGGSEGDFQQSADALNGDHYDMGGGDADYAPASRSATAVLRSTASERQFAADDAANPKFNTEAYDRIVENPFLSAKQNPLSTFSIDVDTAS